MLCLGARFSARRGGSRSAGRWKLWRLLPRARQRLGGAISAVVKSVIGDVASFAWAKNDPRPTTYPSPGGLPFLVKSSFLELLLKYWLQEADKSFVGLFVSRSCSAMSSMSGDRDSAKSGVRNGRTRASDAGQRREREGALCNRWGKSRACRRRFSALEEMSSDIQFIHSSRTAMEKQHRSLKWGRCPQLCIVPRYPCGAVALSGL